MRPAWGQTQGPGWRGTLADLWGSSAFVVRKHKEKKKKPHKIYICQCINCLKHLLLTCSCHSLSYSHGLSWTGSTGLGVLGAQSTGGCVELPSSAAPAAHHGLRSGSLAAGEVAGGG